MILTSCRELLSVVADMTAWGDDYKRFNILLDLRCSDDPLVCRLQLIDIGGEEKSDSGPVLEDSTVS